MTATTVQSVESQQQQHQGLASSFFSNLKVHYRAPWSKFMSPINDWFIVPCVTLAAAAPSSVDISLPFTVTLCSTHSTQELSPSGTVSEGGESKASPTAAQPSWVLRNVFKDATCPTCAVASSRKTTLNDLRGSTMMRCEHCLLCPRCRAVVLEVYLTQTQRAWVYCQGCSWRSPKFANSEELTVWLGQCSHPLLRTGCGFAPTVAPLQFASASFSVSSSARHLSNEAIAEGTASVPTSRAEAVRQMEAFLQKETERLLSGRVAAEATEQSFQMNRHARGNTTAAAADATLLATSPRNEREGSAASSEATTATAAQSPSGLFVVPPHAVTRHRITSGSSEGCGGDEPAVPFVTPPMAFLADLSQVDPRDVASAVQQLGDARCWDAAVPFVAYAKSNDEEISSKEVVSQPQGQSYATAATTELLHIQKAPRLPRFSVVVAPPVQSQSVFLFDKRKQDPSTMSPQGVAGVSSSRQLAVNATGSMEKADGVSISFFTSSLSNPQLSSSLAAARFIPHLFLPADVSPWRALDAKAHQSASQASAVSHHMFFMLQTLSEECVATVHQVRLVAAEGCDLALSGSNPRAVVCADGGVPLARKRGSAAPTTSKFRSYVDNRVADVIFPRGDEMQCVGYYSSGSLEGGPLVFGALVTTIPGAGEQQQQRCAEFEVDVTLKCQQLSGALRRAFADDVPSGAGLEHLRLQYRAIVTFIC